MKPFNLLLALLLVAGCVSIDPDPEERMPWKQPGPDSCVDLCKGDPDPDQCLQRCRAGADAHAQGEAS